MEYTNQLHTVFAGDLNVDVMNNANVMRNNINTLHLNNFINEIYLPTFIWPSNGSVISLIDHVWRLGGEWVCVCIELRGP